MGNAEALEPRRTGVVVFDLLECYRDRIEAAGVIPAVQTLLDECRRRGAAVLYVRADHRTDAADANRTLTDVTESFEPWGDDGQDFGFPHPPELLVPIRELAPQPGDYDVPKHRWSAFYQTSLDLSLRARGIDTVLLVGGSTHVGIASTAYAARDMDYQVIVVADGLTGYEPQRSFFRERVFPRMCRVRTVDEVIAMFDRAA